MRTKKVAPWNLKVGQKLIQYGMKSNAPDPFEIVKIRKERGVFTGKTIWRVTTTNPLWPETSFHGKGRLLPVMKAEIVCP